MNNLKFNLSISKNELYATLNYQIKPTDNFIFHLSSEMKIDELLINNNVALFEKEITKLDFIGDVQKITISYSGITSIELSYHGEVKGWHNRILDDKILLSFYSCYYPQQTNIALDDVKIFIDKGKDFELVNGNFDENLNKWVYDASKAEYGDYNLALFRVGTFYKNRLNNIYFYTTKEEELNLINRGANLSEEILSYYASIYQAEKKRIISIVSNGLEDGGAYIRPNLIMLAALKDSEYFWYRLLGHELGHLWASGADTNSCEDWMNETCAEWSCLSFMSHQGRHDLFDKELNVHLEYALKYASEKIITADGSRPEGVHFRGVALFNLVYQQYGLDAINQLLKIFYDLDEKTTTAYLSKIKDYSEPIYEIISNYIY